MEVINTPVSPYIQNAPIAYCPSTLESIYVDPGDEIEKLISVSDELNLKPQYVFITHGHIDHAGAAAELARELNLKIIGPHIEDKFLLDVLEIQGQMYGMKAENFTPSKWLNHNDSISFGNQKLEILLCPGHTPGHIIAVNHQANANCAAHRLNMVLNLKKKKKSLPHPSKNYISIKKLTFP